MMRSQVFLRVFKIILFLRIASCLSLPANIHSRDDAKVVRFGVSIKGHKPSTAISPRDDQKSFSEPLDNGFYFFLLDLKIGSNSQPLSFILDTGSADFWVPLSTAEFTNSQNQGGTFDKSSSTSYKALNESFNAAYGGNTTSSGNLATDQIVLPNGQKIATVTFGAADKVNRGFYSFLGVSFDSQERTPNSYQNFPAALKQNGLIDKVAYSLYLTDNQEQSGEILFGGIDHAKYQGELESLPLASERLALPLSTITDSNGNVHDAKDLSVLFDTGTTGIFLPQDLFQEIGKTVTGARYVPDTNQFVVDSCSLPDNEFLSFKLGNTSIKVPFSDLLQPDCTLGIQSSVSLYNINILGISFLKQAYTVYDLDGKSISLAPIKYTSESDVRPIS